MKPLVPLALVLAFVAFVSCGDEDLEFGEPSDNTATPSTPGTSTPGSTSTPGATTTPSSSPTVTPGF